MSIPLHLVSNKSLCNVSVSGAINKVLEVVFQIVCLWLKIIAIPITYPISWLFSFIDSFFKIGSVALNFLFFGIRKTEKKLKIGPFESRIHYAVLKGNGQYLKLKKKTIEEIFTCQLYDYSIRKFMTVSHIDKNIKIAEIQFWSTTGLTFVKENFELNNVVGLSNSHEKISKLKSKKTSLDFSFSDYFCQSSRNVYDTLIFFNRGESFNDGESSIDIIKILGFIKKNLNCSGYAVVGNTFTSEDESKVFEEMIESFDFKIEMKEDITSNIIHSRKILNRIHENRKIAWTYGKMKDSLTQIFSIENAFTHFVNCCWTGIQEIIGVKQKDCLYQLYILEHAK